MSKKQMGFTLIEIVMVLVLLGILSAVAVPKYFDLQEQALNNAAKATVAEFQSRLNARFASGLLQGLTCKDAKKASWNGTSATGITGLTTALTHESEDFGSWTIKTFAPGDNDTTSDLIITYKGVDYPKNDGDADYKITLPRCN